VYGLKPWNQRRPTRTVVPWRPRRQRPRRCCTFSPGRLRTGGTGSSPRRPSIAIEVEPLLDHVSIGVLPGKFAAPLLLLGPLARDPTATEARRLSRSVSSSRSSGTRPRLPRTGALPTRLAALTCSARKLRPVLVFWQAADVLLLLACAWLELG
jgi:hypothetical protein